ncbi:MAG TPA: hypothetical protein VF546_24400 [Pyrinomonadaceae bacterium]|jgi:hypothetical protein
MSAAVTRAELERAYQALWAWCRARDFAGHDPFDALNSRLFQATPLRRSRLARLAWTQALKRAPVNLRPLLGVPREQNPKGLALAALAALARYRTTRADEDEATPRTLLDELLAHKLDGWRGPAWGYNFDWQGRAFYAPRGTPAVVPTAFAARALVEAADALAEPRYLRTARATCDFILQDLRRTAETEEEVCFSYTPLDTTRVFNASLLAGEVLAAVGARTGERELSATAARAARYVVRRQRADGSWAYGADSYQTWADNFHTAFILTSLARIVETDDERRAEFAPALRRGYDFWRAHFFRADGWPKYFPDRLYPADAHSAAAAVVALCELHDTAADALPFARTVAAWALGALRDPRGFFYYQRRRFRTVRTPHMRWAETWMLYALARLIEGKKNSRQ